MSVLFSFSLLSDFDIMKIIETKISEKINIETHSLINLIKDDDRQLLAKQNVIIDFENKKPRY